MVARHVDRPSRPDTEREIRLNEVLAEALDRPPEKRREYVREACGDASLREEVLALLEDMEGLAGFLEQPAIEIVADDGEPDDGDPAESLLGTRIGHMRVVELLEKGGMGELYLGFDEKLHREVALKVIRGLAQQGPRARELFLREARFLSRLEHPHICRVYDYIEGEASDVLVLELIRGKNLAEAQKDGLDENLLLPIAEQTAQALAAAHAQNLVHCDLKPANVMLTAAYEVKVLDFGIAHSLDMLTREEPEARAGARGPGVTWRWREGAPVGTPGYMSPEQARGEPVEPPTDVYALGLVLQELFTGKPAYRDASPRALQHKMVRGEPAPVLGLDAALTALIQDALALKPQARPTAREMEQRLRALRRARERRLAADRGDRDTNAKKLLLIDDDPDVIRLMTLRFRKTKRFAIVSTVHATQAVRLARAERPDLILCDVDMPGMSGGEVAAALDGHPETAGIPLMFLSSLVSPAETGPSGLVGGRLMISKQAPFPDILAKVDEGIGP